MAKLVILNQGLSGHSYDLKVGRTTIGRVDDNSFEISDPSVSSHHCEIHWRGGDAKEAFFRDLGSTNGSFLNGEKFTEGVIVPGQSLRLGYVELSFVDESGGPVSLPSAPAPAAAAAPSAPEPSAPAAYQPPPPPPPAPANNPPPPPPKKSSESTLVIPRGVDMRELEQGGTKAGGFNNTTIFTKKKKNPNKIFVVVGCVIGFVIVVLIIVAFVFVSKNR
jgi:hypothetical protein